MIDSDSDRVLENIFIGNELFGQSAALDSLRNGYWQGAVRGTGNDDDGGSSQRATFFAVIRWVPVLPCETKRRPFYFLAGREAVRHVVIYNMLVREQVEKGNCNGGIGDRIPRRKRNDLDFRDVERIQKPAGVLQVRDAHASGKGQVCEITHAQ